MDKQIPQPEQPQKIERGVVTDVVVPIIGSVVTGAAGGAAAVYTEQLLKRPDKKQ